MIAVGSKRKLDHDNESGRRVKPRLDELGTSSGSPAPPVSRLHVNKRTLFRLCTPIVFVHHCFLAMQVAPSSTLFVQREGAPVWAVVIVPRTGNVALLKETIKQKLEMPDRLDTITVHLAKVDDCDTVMEVASAPLPSDKEVAELPDRARIVARVAAGTTLAAHRANEIRKGGLHQLHAYGAHWHSLFACCGA
jgi:hypothetical protein